MKSYLKKILSHLPQKTADKGFTLLETMVALSVILAASVGPISLITKGLADFSFVRNKLIAANLAQEGIEFLRLVRDNNILCDSLNGSAVWEWNRDPSGALIQDTAVTADAFSTTAINTDCGGHTIFSPTLNVFTDTFLRYDNNKNRETYGLYNYTNGGTTIFKRKIEIKSPPHNPDPSIDQFDQMDIISTVSWEEKGKSKSVVLRERLYNWR